MDALYAKLYDKFTKLKVHRFAEMDELNKGQEEKFVECISAAEDMINFLKMENEELRTQNNHLRNEVASVSSSRDEQLAEYQMLLVEENQKNETLSKELERLQNLQQEGLYGSSKENRNKNTQLNTPERAQVESVDVSNGEARKTNRKRGGYSLVEAVTPTTGHTMQQPERSSGNIDCSGGDENDNDPANCMFHFLVECLLGMKISTANHNERLCILALHEPSGYSISLRMVNTGAGMEVELLIHVISLGTLGRVALECMREDIILSRNMCPIFFERVSRVIKLA